MWIRWILLAFISLPAWGFKLTQDFVNGFYWASLPINITVIDSNASRKATLERLAARSVQEWESRSGLDLWDLTSAASTNVIRWSDNFAAETNMDPRSVLAVAIRYTSGPYFAKTEIVINGSNDFNKIEKDLYTTITHELGHTMGLDHSDVPWAVMAPSLQLNYVGLQSDDIDGMKEAYTQTSNRQLTGYVSPLSYSTSSSQQPLSCATVGPATAGAGWTLNGLFSLASGLLISFVRKLRKLFKSKS